ncbi:hypothetical protein NC651_036958 [Populus alba x Populus x berolinensis]|nr:hypothetical protein NC651_036958 [Populus alba x Populus x berolinensis]
MKNAKKVFTHKKIKHGCKQSLRVQAHHKNRAYLDEDHIPAHKHSNCKGREAYTYDQSTNQTFKTVQS